MKIQGMRWGYDGGGFGCGPMGGTCIVEVTFVGEDGKEICCSSCLLLSENCEGIMVTKEPQFDTFMERDYDPNDLAEDALEATDHFVNELIWEMKEDHIDDPFRDSPYGAEIRFTRSMMELYLSADGFPDEDTAAEAISPYIGHDTNEYTLPFATYGCEDDEDWEEEEGEGEDGNP